MDKAIIDHMNIYKYRRKDEAGYCCTVCEKEVSLDGSFSNRGRKLICSSCANKKAQVEGMSLASWLRIYINPLAF